MKIGETTMIAGHHRNNLIVGADGLQAVVMQLPEAFNEDEVADTLRVVKAVYEKHRRRLAEEEKGG